MEIPELVWLTGAVIGSAFLCAGTWLVLAQVVGLEPPIRGAIAVSVPIAAGGMALAIDGAPFNGVVAAVLFLPVLALNVFVVLRMESTRAL